MLHQLEAQMREAAKKFEFEKAAQFARSHPFMKQGMWRTVFNGSHFRAGGVGQIKQRRVSGLPAIKGVTPNNATLFERNDVERRSM